MTTLIAITTRIAITQVITRTATRPMTTVIATTTRIAITTTRPMTTIIKDQH